MAAGAITYSVTIDPSPVKIAKALGALGRDLKTWKPAFERIAPHFAKGIQENVDTRGRALVTHEGSKAAWGPINKKYQGRKARKGGGGELHVSGDMLEEAKSLSSHNLKITGTTLQIGLSMSGEPRAIAQQWGRKEPKGTKGGNMPRRFMGFNVGMQATSIREMNRYADILMMRTAQALKPKGGK